jgi:hypothetical protein
VAKQAFDMAKQFLGGSSSAQPTLPGLDPAVTQTALNNAIANFPDNPRQASDQLAANAGISPAQADALIKQHHPEGKRFDRAASKAAKRKLSLGVTQELTNSLGIDRAAAMAGVNPQSINERLAPLTGWLGGLFPGLNPQFDELNAGIVQ